MSLTYFPYYLLKSIFQAGWGVPIVDQNYSFLHMKGPLENVEVGDIILKSGEAGRREG